MSLSVGFIVENNRKTCCFSSISKTQYPFEKRLHPSGTETVRDSPPCCLCSLCAQQDDDSTVLLFETSEIDGVLSCLEYHSFKTERNLGQVGLN